MHEDVVTVMGEGLAHYTQEPFLQDGKLVWRQGATESLDPAVLRGAAEPFSADGGLKLLKGNLGRGVIKISAVSAEHQVVEAPALVFDDQDQVAEAFKRGELEKDFVAVVRYQGPKAIGMPELHKLTPYLGTLQDRGFKVALVTDGRMSGASGKVPAAIHVWPEAANGGALARVRSGDMVRLDARTGSLELMLDAAEFAAREATVASEMAGHQQGMGRELFAPLRQQVSAAEEGASIFFQEETDA
jgi:phosphogluconate dehydratase